MITDLSLPPRGIRHLLQRVGCLYLGLVLFGLSMAMFVNAGLGLVPWDVLHQGISRHTGWSLGTSSIVVGAVVLLAWLPLRERPGFGTVSNVFVIGLSLDAGIRLLPTPSPVAVRIPLMLAGILLNAFATLLYINARFGSGPRDGLLTALLRLTTLPTGVLKTSIEVIVVAVGWLLGGSLGIGTLAFTVGIGPAIQLLVALFPRLALRTVSKDPAVAVDPAGAVVDTADGRESLIMRDSMIAGEGGVSC